MDQSEERICETEDITLKLSSQRSTKKKERKGVKQTYVFYGLPSEEPSCELLEFQKKKRAGREQKTYLKK